MSVQDALDIGGIGYGAMRLTGPGVWGCPENRNRAQEVLIEVVKLGINLVDTADAYGPYSNEELIHETLSPYPTGMTVATKGGLVRGNDRSWHPNGRPDHLRRACEGSLKRLGLDTIELYQLHSPDPEVPFEESIGALAELRDAGKINHIGLSNVEVGQLEAALAITPVASVQNRMNLVERGSETVLRACEESGIRFLPYFPVAAGDLALSGSVTGDDSERTKTLRRIASDHGSTVAQVSLAWLIALSSVVVPIPGTSDPEHLRENFAATKISLSDDEMKLLERL